MTKPDCNRICNALADQGFELQKLLNPHGWFTLVRSSKVPDIFESVSFESSGRNGRTWHTILRLSIMKGTHWLTDFTVVDYLGNVGEEIRGGSSRKRWEDHLIEHASCAATALAVEGGQGLLASTEEVRRLGIDCLGKLRLGGDVWQLLDWLRSQARSCDIEESARLAGEPAINNLADEEPTYTSAALALLIFGHDLDADLGWWNSRMWSNPAFVIRLQYIADLLFRKGLGRRVIFE